MAAVAVVATMTVPMMHVTVVPAKMAAGTMVVSGVTATVSVMTVHRSTPLAR
jgi:hypothetical protein